MVDMRAIPGTLPFLKDLTLGSRVGDGGLRPYAFALELMGFGIYSFEGSGFLGLVIQYGSKCPIIHAMVLEA